MVYGCCFWGESYDLHGIFCPTFPLVFLRFLAFWGVPPKKGCFWGGGGGGGRGGGGGGVLLGGGGGVGFSGGGSGGVFLPFFSLLIQNFPKMQGITRILQNLYQNYIFRGIFYLNREFCIKKAFQGGFSPPRSSGRESPATKLAACDVPYVH